MSISGFLRARALSITDNIVAAILFVGGAVVAGWFTDYLAQHSGLTPKVALTLSWAVGLLVFVALSLLLKPKKPQESQTVPTQELNQSGIINAPHNKFKPHNEFNPTLIVNVPISQAQSQQQSLEQGILLHKKMPNLERKGTRRARLPIDPTTNNITANEYRGEEHSLIFTFAKFYYTPEPDTHDWIYVTAHITFYAPNDQFVYEAFKPVWLGTESNRRSFKRAEAHELIIAVSGAELTSSYECEYRKGGRPWFKEHFAPRIVAVFEDDFRVQVQLIAEREGDVVKKTFDYEATQIILPNHGIILKGV